MPLRRVLIANRGEIALRVVRACADLGLASVAVYGPGDEGALHVQLADEAYRLPSEHAKPYLDGAAVLEAARRAGADALHPGYGFLAENADFAEACAAAGVIFVGPSPAAIRAMGEKIAAREIARSAGVPMAAGSHGALADSEAALRFAASAGYPIALKASFGGGGRGFRVVREEGDLPAAFTAAASEAERAFGDGTLYGERYLDRPRHVEVQVFADRQGRTVAIGDRDCSIQRRHQKLVEECPAPGLPAALREEMARAAVALAEAVDYTGAGTIEFLVDASGTFSFLEMNTRIQVEHTVTEEVFGVDLVREQLLVAGGEPLSFTDDLQPRGHAIECRLNAEDPARDFAPAPGRIERFRAPAGPGVRIDAAVAEGSEIHPAYDSLIAKLIVSGADRERAIARMRRALGETLIEGVPSTLELHRAILSHPAYAAGPVTTAFLAEHPEVIPSGSVNGRVAPGDDPAEWRSVTVEVNGRRFEVRVQENGTRPAVATARGKRPAAGARPERRTAAGGGGPELKSPLQGVVLRHAAAVGDEVRKGAVVLVIEAMKMENEIVAHRDGVVTAIPAMVGATVRPGDVLFAISPQG